MYCMYFYIVRNPGFLSSLYVCSHKYDLVTHCFLFVWMQVSPLLPCYIQSPCVATETALRNVISLPTRNCHIPRSPEVPTRAWSWPSARNWTASSSMLRTKTLSPPMAWADGGLSFFVTASRVTVSCCPSQMPGYPATRPTGTRAKQQGCLIMPWGCWSATQQRSLGCCGSHSLVFGPVTAGQDYIAGTSRQEEDRHSLDTRATAEMNVSIFKFNSLYLPSTLVTFFYQWLIAKH